MTNPWWQELDDDPEDLSDGPLCDCTGNLIDPMCSIHGDYDPYYATLKEADSYEY